MPKKTATRKTKVKNTQRSVDYDDLLIKRLKKNNSEILPQLSYENSPHNL